MAYKRARPVSPSASQKRSRGSGPAHNIKLGTELPPEEDGDDGAFVPVWKQTVTDERGRRRLHGAFTGGFSAGYFNTVGSKGGWTPKAFVSSRSNRNKNQKDGGAQMRPEDFMDDEDLAEAAESRSLETAQNFAAVGVSGGPGALKDDFFGLFISEEDTMGVKILQKMGWRRDQGVGRKVRRTARQDDAPGMESHDSSAQHHFAPKDTSVMTAAHHERRRGLGFQSETRLSRAGEEHEARESPSLAFLDRHSKPSAQKQAPLKKSSFGVGVLNDTGSDDEDPYELGPKITFNRTVGKDKKAKKPSKFAKAGISEKVVYVPKRAAAKPTSSLVSASDDGRIPLRGFVFATVIVAQSKKQFPPPQIPPGWKSSKGAANTADTQGFQSVADAAKSSTLDAKSRADLLGEAPLPGKSVFDYLSQDARDRIAAITGKTNLPQGRGETAPEGHKPEAQHKSLWTFVPNLDKDVAAAALAKGATGWMPYAEDLKKRARYVAFLELRAGMRHDLPERPPHMSVSDWAKELQEFAHAALVFKPTSGLMASRFTSSTASSQAGTNSSPEGSSLLRTASTKPEDPAEQAAKLGMYGPMTRSQFAFYPSRLLCKRFNVPPPVDVPLSADPGEAFGSKTQEPVSKPEMDRMVHEYLTRGNNLQRPAWMNAPSDIPMSSATASTTVPVAPGLATQHATVDVEKNEALAQERAPDDVFKAVFGDDDDD